MGNYNEIDLPIVADPAPEDPPTAVCLLDGEAFCLELPTALFWLFTILSVVILCLIYKTCNAREVMFPEVDIESQEKMDNKMDNNK